MELLKKCQTLYEELKTLNKDLAYIDQKLNKNDISFDEYEKLYENEFRLAMLMMGCYEDLCHYIDILKEDDNMQFIATRIKTNAESLIITGGIDIDLEIN